MMTLEELKGMLEARTLLLATIEALKSEQDAIEEVIKASMASSGTEEVKVDNFTVRYKKVVSNRLNTTRLKNAMNKEVWLGFCDKSEAMRFTVTEK